MDYLILFGPGVVVILGVALLAWIMFCLDSKQHAYTSGKRLTPLEILDVAEAWQKKIAAPAGLLHAVPLPGRDLPGGCVMVYPRKYAVKAALINRSLN